MQQHCFFLCEFSFQHYPLLLLLLSSAPNTASSNKSEEAVSEEKTIEDAAILPPLLRSLLPTLPLPSLPPLLPPLPTLLPPTRAKKRYEKKQSPHQGEKQRNILRIMRRSREPLDSAGSIPSCTAAAAADYLDPPSASPLHNPAAAPSSRRRRPFHQKQRKNSRLIANFFGGPRQRVLLRHLAAPTHGSRRGKSHTLDDTKNCSTSIGPFGDELIIT